MFVLVCGEVSGRVLTFLLSNLNYLCAEYGQRDSTQSVKRDLLGTHRADLLTEANHEQLAKDYRGINYSHSHHP